MCREVLDWKLKSCSGCFNYNTGVPGPSFINFFPCLLQLNYLEERKYPEISAIAVGVCLRTNDRQEPTIKSMRDFVDKVGCHGEGIVAEGTKMCLSHLRDEGKFDFLDSVNWLSRLVTNTLQGKLARIPGHKRRSGAFRLVARLVENRIRLFHLTHPDDRRSTELEAKFKETMRRFQLCHWQLVQDLNTLLYNQINLTDDEIATPPEDLVLDVPNVTY